MAELPDTGLDSIVLRRCELPRNPTGKVLKFQLREQFADK